MKIHLKNLSITTVLFLLLSTANAAEEGYYIPIHNLTPIAYNPLTTNYNPDYDNYPGLAMIGSQVNKQADSGSSTATPTDYTSTRRTQIRAELAQLDQEWRDNTSSMMKSSFGNALAKSMQSNQLRFRMKMLNDELLSLNGGSTSSGGCGSRGGPGYRKANGQCASW